MIACYLGLYQEGEVEHINGVGLKRHKMYIVKIDVEKIKVI